MTKTVLLYGLLGGALIVALKVIEYRYLVLTHSFEIYSTLLTSWLLSRRKRAEAPGTAAA